MLQTINLFFFIKEHKDLIKMRRIKEKKNIVTQGNHVYNIINEKEISSIVCMTYST